MTTPNNAPRTLFEKVWQQHLVAEPAGEPALLYIDLQLVHEVTSPRHSMACVWLDARSAVPTAPWQL